MIKGDSMDNLFRLESTVKTAEEILPLNQVKSFLNVSSNRDNELLSTLRSFAIEAVEAKTGVIIQDKQLTRYFDYTGGKVFRLDALPILSVDSVAWVDKDGVEHELTSEYLVYSDKVYPLIVFDDTVTVGNVRDVNGVKITATFGYNGALPEFYKTLVLQIIGASYVNRDGELVERLLRSIPKRLLYR